MTEIVINEQNLAALCNLNLLSKPRGFWPCSLGWILSVFPVLFYITQPSKCDSILSYDLSYLLRGGVPYHGQFQKSYQRRIEYGGTGKTTTKQNTINNSWMSLGRLVFGSGLFVCSASLENSQIPRWFFIYENKNKIR